jgi:Arc-like DNA binding domain
MARKPSEQVKLNLRFTEALRSRLEKQAARNNRSMNEEIIRRLEDSFRRDDLMTVVDALSDKITVKVTEVLKQGRALTVSDVLDGEKK